MTKLTASLDFVGYSDYWRGMSDRGRGHGAAFAYYNGQTTVRDLVDQWVDETWNNEHDFEDLPESVTQDDIRDCILAAFTDAGRADYESNALCEWAADFDGENECVHCEQRIGELHSEDCDYYEEGEDIEVERDDCIDQCGCLEYPQAIMEISWADHPDYYQRDR